jgi:hypothetical protein
MSLPGIPDSGSTAPQVTAAGAIGIAAAVAQLSLASLLIKPQRSIGPFTAHATVKETHTDTLQITEHPVEQGAMIADHAFKLPAEVVIEAMWSDSPSAGIQSGIASGAAYSSAFLGQSPGQVTDIYNKLLALQDQRVLFDVYTGKRVYRNMLLRQLAVVTDEKNEHALRVTATCRQVVIARTQTLTINTPASAQADPGSTAATTNQGAKALQPAPQFRH